MTNFVSKDNLISNLNWRYATKQFDASKKITPDVWSAMEDALVLTASSFGLQPWKFIVVEKPETRKALREVSWNQSQVTDASHYVVFCGLNNMKEDYVIKYMKRICETRNADIAQYDSFKNMILGFAKNMSADEIKTWNAKQVYIALGNVLTSAAMLGIDTCAMEGLDKSKYDEILGLNGTDYSTCFACAFGYRNPEDDYAKRKKVRFSKEDVIQKF